MAKFKQEILEEIKRDPDLFAIVAKKTGMKPQSLASTIHRNGSSLNEYSVVVVVAAYLKRNPEDLLEDESEVKEPAR